MTQNEQAREARCHCGALNLHCAGDPAKVSLCHCRECQRRTGSLFSVAAFYLKDAVTLPGASAGTFRRVAASGFSVDFHFCRSCGTTLWWEPARMPLLIGVAAGCFADPDFPQPDQAVWTAEGHAWLRLPDTIPAHCANPPPRRAD